MRMSAGLFAVLMLPVMAGHASALGPCPGFDMVPVPFGYGSACVRQPPIPMPPPGSTFRLPEPGDDHRTSAQRQRQRARWEPAR
jgi:hypothetical protein